MEEVRRPISTMMPEPDSERSCSHPILFRSWKVGWLECIFRSAEDPLVTMRCGSGPLLNPTLFRPGFPKLFRTTIACFPMWRQSYLMNGT